MLGGEWDDQNQTVTDSAIPRKSGPTNEGMRQQVPRPIIDLNRQGNTTQKQNQIGNKADGMVSLTDDEERRFE